MEVEILFFAQARDLVGRASLRLEVPPGLRLAEVVETIAAQHPALRPALASMRFAINEEFATVQQRVVAGDRIAFLPPVSGG